MQLATEKLEKTSTTTRKLKYKRLDIKHRYGIKDKGMEERIMGSIREIIKQEKDFDDQRPLLHLPQKLKRDIMLCICKSPFEKGKLLDKMLFINQGTVCTFSTNYENRTGYLKKGDFYGEELLKWVLAPLASSGPSEQIPFSKMTLKCKTKVEVFTLWVDDLRNIVSGTDLRIEKFRLIIGCTDTKDELEDVAAKCLQAAYRRHRAQLKNSNGPRKATKSEGRQCNAKPAEWPRAVYCAPTRPNIVGLCAGPGMGGPKTLEPALYSVGPRYREARTDPPDNFRPLQRDLRTLRSRVLLLLRRLDSFSSSASFVAVCLAGGTGGIKTVTNYSPDSLASAIDTQFGSLQGLTQKVNAEASDLLGSGWVTKMELQDALLISRLDDVNCVIEVESSIDANATFQSVLKKFANQAANHALSVLSKVSVQDSSLHCVS
ncbi:Cyclic nucleotide-gated ion channel 1 [Morella rubra]|uniref:Cyclic nucleotide-gated ion channel 1 n=1 Tax=Morella rubra TaxID=262757 RepID=A0A6A1V2K9_9ROSI|nr:Cyclic nucleotide-gated ion channel 1 [Morella rubra]